MRKIAALLLALLLPLSALAEGSTLTTWSWSADSDAVSAWMLAVGMDEQTVQALAQPAADLMNALSMTVQTDGRDYAAAVYLQQESMLTFRTFTTEDGLQALQSNLLPDVTLTFPIMQTSVLETENSVETSDWVSAAVTDMISWLDGCTFELVDGPVTGDAYDGGSWCMNVTVTDRDLALLLETLADDLPAAVRITDSVLVRKVLQSMAMTNTGSALLKLVYNDASDLEGISLTMMADGEAYATLSVGLTQSPYRAVLSYRKGDTVTILDMDLNIQNSQLAFNVSLYHSEPDTTLAMLKASGVQSELQVSSTLQGKSEASGTSWQVNADLTLKNAGTTAVESTGSVTAEGAINSVTTVYYGENRTEAWRLTVSSAEADALPAVTADGTTAVSVLDATNDDTISVLLESVGNALPELYMELLTQIPESVLTLLLQLLY